MRLVRKPFRRAFPFTHENLRPPIVGRRRCLSVVHNIVFDGRQLTDTEAQLTPLYRAASPPWSLLLLFVVCGAVKKEIILAVRP